MMLLEGVEGEELLLYCPIATSTRKASRLEVVLAEYRLSAKVRQKALEGEEEGVF